MGKVVYVITDSEGGWDCVRGVYLDKSEAEKEVKDRNGKDKDYPYLLHEKELKSKFEQ